MNIEDVEKLEKQIASKYFLIKKHSIIYFLGGFVAIVIAILGLGYKSVYEVLDSEFSERAREEILQKQEELSAKDTEIQELIDTLTKTNQQMIKFKEEVLSNINISNEPLKIPKPVSFKNNIYYTMSYWSGGADSSGPYYCSQPTIPDGFEFVYVGSLSARERPFCKVPSKHCDSAGEFCKNYKVTQSCLINTVWHEWYKNYVKKNMLPYDITVVCRQLG